MRKAWPSRQQRRAKLLDEFAQAERLKKEIESRAQWDNVWKHYGEYLIRNIDYRLPKTEEIHGSRTAYPFIGVLTDIHTEHLEFIFGASGIKFIKNIAGFWHFADEHDQDAIKVDTVCWLNYREIVLIRWELDPYWEWPQICCKFKSGDKSPFSRFFFAQEKTGLQRPFYHEVCLLSDVFPKPISVD